MNVAEKKAGVTAVGKINLDNELARWRSVLDKALADFFTSSARANGDLPLGKYELDAFDKLAEFSCRSGKRIRGGLAMFSYERLGGKKRSTGLKLGVAIELIQNYFLIIDDVMDRSTTRRGKPTLHKIFRQELNDKLSKGESEHVGDMLAINTGLLAQHLAAKLMAEIDEEPELVNYASRLFQNNILGTTYGQIGDMYSTINRSAKETDILRTHTLKNSYYTFINPLQVGAVLAGKSDEQTLSHLSAIGTSAGIAFQLRDDILGLFGDEKLTGKPSLDDLREGKFTLLMSYAFHNASKAQLKMLQSALGNPRLSTGLAGEVRRVVEETGAKEACQAAAQNFAKSATSEIATNRLFDEPSKHFLTELISYSVDRKA